MVGRIIIAILGIAIGFLMVWKTQKFLDIFGHLASVEAKLGSWGGTRMLYKLLGILIAGGTLLYATGGLGKILTVVFGNLFGGGTGL